MKVTSQGLPTDLTGCSVYLTAKESFLEEDLGSFIDLKITDFGDDPTLGEFLVPIDFTGNGDEQFERSKVYHANVVIVDSLGETTHSDNFQIRVISGATKNTE
jgi:hypothetical protein